VINGLTDLLHPCQALADIMTIQEYKGKLAGLKLTYMGDGNNVAHSLLFAGAKTGMHVTVASPAAYAPQEEIVRLAREDALETGGTVTVTDDLASCCQGGGCFVYGCLGQYGAGRGGLPAGGKPWPLIRSIGNC
jgi:ornithine carbamoyltransferase